jgi:hypothetical protein
MSEEQNPETAESAETETDGSPKRGQRSQIPAHVPPHLREMFTKHEGAIADRPGFRNKANAKTKAQKQGRKDKR